MAESSICLLENTGDNLTLVGSPIRVDGWFGRGDHLYTVAVHVSNFQGVVYIEGSLSTNPESNDWFKVVPSFEFGMWSDDEAGFGRNETRSVGVTFKANIALIRARLDRPDFPDPMIMGQYGERGGLVASMWGFVDRVLLHK